MCVFSLFLGVKLGIQKSCLCKKKDRYEVCKRVPPDSALGAKSTKATFAMQSVFSTTHLILFSLWPSEQLTIDLFLGIKSISGLLNHFTYILSGRIHCRKFELGWWGNCRGNLFRKCNHWSISHSQFSLQLRRILSISDCYYGISGLGAFTTSKKASLLLEGKKIRSTISIVLLGWLLKS